MSEALKPALKSGRPPFEELSPFWQGYIQELSEQVDQMDVMLDGFFRTLGDPPAKAVGAEGFAAVERAKAGVKEMVEASRRYVDLLELACGGTAAERFGPAREAYLTAASAVDKSLKDMLGQGIETEGQSNGDV